MATYRIGGKIVNIPKLEGLNSNDEFGNNVRDNEEAITSAPIYSEHTTLFVPLGLFKMYDINNYGYLQLFFNIQMYGASPLTTFVVQVHNEKGIPVSIREFNTPGGTSSLAKAVTNEMWAFVKPGYTIWAEAINMTPKAVMEFYSFYRLHNANTHSGEEWEIDTKGILSNQVEESTINKFNDYITNTNQIKQYRGDGWDKIYNNTNNKLIQGSVEVNSGFSLVNLVNHKEEYVCKSDGYAEVILNTSNYLEVEATTEIEIRDENWNLIDNSISRIFTIKLTPRRKPNNAAWGGFVKKGWTIVLRSYSLPFIYFWGYNIMIFPSAINGYESEENLIKDNSIIYKLNDYVTHNADIEKYDEEAEEWLPLSDNNEYNVHTTPYMWYKTFFSIAATGETITFPSNGVAYILAAFIGTVEVATSLEITFHDADGKIQKVLIRDIEKSSVRPEGEALANSLYSEVKKGWYARIRVIGASVGKLRLFAKLDPSYKIVEDKNGLLTDGE